MSEGKNDKPALSTWQWLGVIATIVAGVIGIDARMQATVGSFASGNETDHQTIRGEIKDLAANTPPAWFRAQVAHNSDGVDQLKRELSGFRVAITELAATTREIRKRLEEIKE